MWHIESFKFESTNTFFPRNKYFILGIEFYSGNVYIFISLKECISIMISNGWTNIDSMDLLVMNEKNIVMERNFMIVDDIEYSIDFKQFDFMDKNDLRCGIDNRLILLIKTVIDNIGDNDYGIIKYMVSDETY